MSKEDVFTVLPTITIGSVPLKVLTWTVNSKCDNILYSSQFAFFDNMWKIRLSIWTADNRIYIKFILEIVDKKNDTKIGYTICILNGNGEKVQQYFVSSIDEAQKFELPRWLILDGVFTLHCQLTSNLAYLHKQFIMLQNNNTDVIIKVGGEQLKSYKFMLASHSSVFCAMLDFMNAIDIDRFDFETVAEMLGYINLKRFRDLEKLAENMLKIARKYCIFELEERCEESLCKIISPKNVLRLQALAECYNLNQLMLSTKEYIGHNVMALQETAGWKSMLSGFLQKNANE